MAECHHGWRGSSAGEFIQTPCPACGLRSLFIGSGGHLTCSSVPSGNSKGCPSPGVEDTIKALRDERDRALVEVERLTEANRVLMDGRAGRISDVERMRESHEEMGRRLQATYRRYLDEVERGRMARALLEQQIERLKQRLEELGE